MLPGLARLQSKQPAPHPTPIPTDSHRHRPILFPPASPLCRPCWRLTGRPPCQRRAPAAPPVQAAAASGSSHTDGTGQLCVGRARKGGSRAQQAGWATSLMKRRGARQGGARMEHGRSALTPGVPAAAAHLSSARHSSTRASSSLSCTAGRGRVVAQPHCEACAGGADPSGSAAGSAVLPDKAPGGPAYSRALTHPQRGSLPARSRAPGCS